MSPSSYIAHRTVAAAGRAAHGAGGGRPDRRRRGREGSPLVLRRGGGSREHRPGASTRRRPTSTRCARPVVGQHCGSTSTGPPWSPRGGAARLELLRHARRAGGTRAAWVPRRAGRDPHSRPSPTPTRPHRGRAAPSSASCATWYGVYGRGGSFWRTHPKRAATADPAYQVWNEPNYPPALGRRPARARDVADYASLLKLAGGAIRTTTVTRRSAPAGCSPAPPADRPATATSTRSTASRASSATSTRWPSTRTPRTPRA